MDFSCVEEDSHELNTLLFLNQYCGDVTGSV